ncbi:MAG: hypothetical protein ACI33K_11165 [Clostridiaceae bacterium]
MDAWCRKETVLKKILVFLLITVFIIGLSYSISYGRNIKKSYINDVDFDTYLENRELKVQAMPYPFDEDYDIYGSGDSVHSFLELEDLSKIVVRVKLSPEFIRNIYTGCVLSEVEILEIYKGDLEIGEKINIFEPINCTFINSKVQPKIYSYEGYSPMDLEKEYLLFLMPAKNSYFGDNDIIYLPSTITYSKFKLDNNQPKLFTEEELEVEGVIYSEIKDEEVYLYDKKMYELFVKIKAEALKIYNIE